MVGEACLPSNAYYPKTPDYTLYSGVHVCWSEHSDLSLVYGCMRLDYGLVLSAFRTFVRFAIVWFCLFRLHLCVWERLQFVIVTLSGLFSYLFRYHDRTAISCVILCVFQSF